MNRMSMISVFFGFLMVLPSTTLAATYIVHPDGSGDFPHIYAALIDPGVVDGDVIELGDGVFTGPGNVNLHYFGKAVTVQSQSGYPSTCLIDCDGDSSHERYAFDFNHGEGSGSVLANVSIRGAWRDPGGAIVILDASPTITGCIFYENEGHEWDWNFGRGAAIKISGGSPFIQYCYFHDNFAEWQGGAIYAQDTGAQILDCVFDNNETQHQGGAVQLHNSPDAMIEDCRFLDNEANNEGGAIYLSTPTTVTGCYFQGNSADVGGGIFLGGGSGPEISYCTFVFNVGGSLFADYFSPQIRHCTLSHNIGGSYVNGDLYFWSGTGAGVIENTIIAFCDTEMAVGSNDPSAAFTLSCCDVYGNGGGDYVGPILGQNGLAGNISADPLFCMDLNPTEPYSLHGDSPCAGENHPDCDLIGALDVACGATGVQESSLARSWSEVKALY